MSNPESDELHKIIDGIISATRKGDFQWRSVNPSTYVWDGFSRQGAAARLTLQRISSKVDMDFGGLKLGNVVNHHYILQVSEIPTQGLVQGTAENKLTVSGQGEKLLNAKLEELYMLILSGVNEKGIQFLKDIMPN